MTVTSLFLALALRSEAKSEKILQVKIDRLRARIWAASKHGSYPQWLCV